MPNLSYSTNGLLFKQLSYNLRDSEKEKTDNKKTKQNTKSFGPIFTNVVFVHFIAPMQNWSRDSR